MRDNPLNVNEILPVLECLEHLKSLYISEEFEHVILQGNLPNLIHLNNENFTEK